MGGVALMVGLAIGLYGGRSLVTSRRIWHALRTSGRLLMASHRSFVPSWLGAALAAIVLIAALEDAPAAPAESLLPADAAGAPTDATRLDDTVMPAYAGRFREDPFRGDDAYIFSATRIFATPASIP